MVGFEVNVAIGHVLKSRSIPSPHTKPLYLFAEMCSNLQIVIGIRIVFSQ